MPRVLPDGRSESPGVLRMCSMIILALFYATSACVSLILRGVSGILRAVGIMGERRVTAACDSGVWRPCDGRVTLV
jgi:hypothetical protein